MGTATVTCPQCHGSFKVGDAIAPGKKVRCPRCKALFSVRGDPDDPVEEKEVHRPRRKARRNTQSSNPVLLWSLITGGIVLLAGGIVAICFLVADKGKKDQEARQEPKGGEKKTLGGWAPDPDLLDKLGPEEKVQGYKIRPPRGYVLEDKKVGLVKRFVWKGPLRSDQQNSLLIMEIYPRDPERPSIDRALNNALDSIKKERQGEFPFFDASALEYGTVNGRDFARRRLNLTKKAGSIRLKGFIYFTLVDKGKGMLFLSAEPLQYDQDVQVHEASVQTFDK
jgi:predicted Zn finger-like uncharacterized protein